jgi:hypothetical protein
MSFVLSNTSVLEIIPIDALSEINYYIINHLDLFLIPACTADHRIHALHHQQKEQHGCRALFPMVDLQVPKHSVQVSGVEEHVC